MNKLAMLTCCAAIGLSSHTGTALAGEKKPTIEGAWEVVVTLRSDASRLHYRGSRSRGRRRYQSISRRFTPTSRGEPSVSTAPAHRQPIGPLASVSGNRRGKASPTPENTLFDTRSCLFDGSQMQNARIDVRGDISLTPGGNKLTGVARYVADRPQRKYRAVLRDGRGHHGSLSEAEPAAARPDRVGAAWGTVREVCCRAELMRARIRMYQPNCFRGETRHLVAPTLSGNYFTQEETLYELTNEWQ